MKKAMQPIRHIVAPGAEVARAFPRRRETMTAFLRRTGWAKRDRVYGWQFPKGLPTILEINGEPVLRKEWSRRRMKLGDQARFISVPLGTQGGNNKQVIGLVALAAVGAFAAWAGPAAISALLPSGFAPGALATGAGWAVTAGICTGGQLRIDALATEALECQLSMF